MGDGTMGLGEVHGDDPTWSIHLGAEVRKVILLAGRKRESSLGCTPRQKKPEAKTFALYSLENPTRGKGDKDRSAYAGRSLPRANHCPEAVPSPSATGLGTTDTKGKPGSARKGLHPEQPAQGRARVISRNSAELQQDGKMVLEEKVPVPGKKGRAALSKAPPQKRQMAAERTTATEPEIAPRNSLYLTNLGL